LEFLVAAMPSRKRMGADAACVTCMEAFDICGRFGPRLPRYVAASVFKKLAERLIRCGLINPAKDIVY
jgi:hypothetical protein